MELFLFHVDFIIIIIFFDGQNSVKKNTLEQKKEPKSQTLKYTGG